jgi:hypothetical protein
MEFVQGGVTSMKTPQYRGLFYERGKVPFL